jgi:hypothetical protein
MSVATNLNVELKPQTSNLSTGSGPVADALLLSPTNGRLRFWLLTISLTMFTLLVLLFEWLIRCQLQKHTLCHEGRRMLYNVSRLIEHII